MRPSLSGRSLSLMLLSELRQEPAQLRVLRNSPRAMPLFGLPIMVVTSLRTSRKLCKLQRASACGGPEIRVCRSGLFAPVILQIDRHGCRSWVFAPVVVKLIHHVCKTTPFAHVTVLFGRHPKCWTDLTIINKSMRTDCLSEGSVTKAAALSVKRDVGQRSGDRTQPCKVQ